MSELKNVVPTGAPDSPPFADTGYAHLRGNVVTLVFMRASYIPGTERVTTDGAVLSPVVASVTMTLEGAQAVMKLLAGVLSSDKPEVVHG